MQFKLRPALESDRTEIAEILTLNWGATRSVSRGRIHQADRYPALVAVSAEKICGLLTYIIEDEALGVVTLNSLIEGSGIGRALLNAVS